MNEDGLLVLRAPAASGRSGRFQLSVQSRSFTSTTASASYGNYLSYEDTKARGRVTYPRHPHGKWQSHWRVSPSC